MKVPPPLDLHKYIIYEKSKLTENIINDLKIYQGTWHSANSKERIDNFHNLPIDVAP